MVMNKKKCNKRCRRIWLSAPLCLLFLYLAYSSDGSSATATPPQSNVNANVCQPLTLYTENTTPAALRSSAMYGLEIPSLQTGSADAFIVHTLPDGILNYCIGYNTRLKANCWTAYKWYEGNSSNDEVWKRGRWRKGESFNGYGGSADPFQPDPVLPKKLRTHTSDYGKGYQRGHILGSADRLNSKEANGQTFYLSNIHPQLPDFNEQGIWYNLEQFLRNNYDKPFFRDTLYIVKGGTISKGDYKKIKASGAGYLVCPKYFYMAILAYSGRYSKTNGGYKAIAFWMEHKENDDKVSAKYAITIDELEKRTGIDFFCNLPDETEAAVEKETNLSYWKLKHSQHLSK